MRPRRENDARKRNRAGKREGKSWRRTDRVSHEREQSWLHPREIDWRRINPCGWAATGVTVQVASLGRERKGGTAQQGKEGKRIDPKIIVQRLSPTAMKGGKKKKRKSCENSKSLARNRQQIDSNIANCCYVMFHHPRGIDRGLGRVGSREMHGVVKIERYFSTRQQVGMWVTRSRKLRLQRKVGRRFFCVQHLTR